MSVILSDTRQKAGKHQKKEAAFKSMGVEVFRSKLAFGDYCLPPSIAVDTKAGIQEIAANLCGSRDETKRVTAEMKLARACGSTLIFLIEVGKYRQPSDLIGERFVLMSGKVISGEQLYRAMETVSARYGCRFVFCPPAEAGRKVIELLKDGNNGHEER